jgi:4-amino-4-deoxy-L-arabinose transferase-like glycosyltransferase
MSREPFSGVGVWDWGVGIFVVALLYVAPLLLNAPLTDPDEGLHAAISQEMVERGDFIVPRFLGRPFLDKPILFFWAQAASMRAFGMNTAAARLPGLTFALLGIVTTGWLVGVLVSNSGRGSSGEPRPCIAAGCYATMVLPFLLAQAAVHDIALVPFANLTLGLLWRAGRDPGFGVRDCVLASVALGLSILTKGLEVVAIVGLGYAVYLTLTRTLTWRLIGQGAFVVVVALLVAVPWYVAMNSREPGYLRYYFVDRHLLGFATATQEHHGQAWWYYLPVVIGGGLPWIVFAGHASIPAPKRLAWAWLGTAIVLLTLSQSKAVTYVLPAMPAIAILAATSLAAQRVFRFVAVTTAVIVSAALFVFGPRIAAEHSARDLAAYFNASGRLPQTIFVFDHRVSFVYYLLPQVRARLHDEQIQSVSVEQLAAMQPFPHDAVVAIPADLASLRMPRIPPLTQATWERAGRYVVVSP